MKAASARISYCHFHMNLFAITDGKLCGQYSKVDNCQFLPLASAFLSKLFKFSISTHYWPPPLFFFAVPEIPWPTEPTAQMTIKNGHVRFDGQRVLFASYNQSLNRIYDDEYMTADFLGFTESSSDMYHRITYSEVYAPPLVPVAMTDGKIGFLSTLILPNNVSFIMSVELNSTFAPYATHFHSLLALNNFHILHSFLIIWE